MGYQCPRCGEHVQRGTSSTAGVAGGAIGALLYAAFGSFQCKQCGPIPTSEFPPNVRSQMALGSIAMVFFAVLLLVVLVVLMVYLRR